jgi:hypothetical protein
MSSSLRADASGILGALTINGVDSVTFDAAGITGGMEHPLKSIVASVASNALTVGLAATTLEFRSATLSIGATTRLVTPSLTMTIPTGATLGSVSGVSSRVLILAINASGVVELAVVNQTGAAATSLDESGLISTTALTTGSTSANVVYSTTARTNVPFRVVGSVDSTQATAGTWATTPSLVTPCGGNALTSMASLGYGQFWQTMTGSRVANTNYTNTTGRPIVVAATITGSGGAITAILKVDGKDICTTYPSTAGSPYVTVSAIVPHGSVYQIFTASATLSAVYELR